MEKLVKTLKDLALWAAFFSGSVGLLYVQYNYVSPWLYGNYSSLSWMAAIGFFVGCIILFLDFFLSIKIIKD